MVRDGNAPGHEGTPPHSEGRGRGRGLLLEKKLPNCHEVQRAVTQERVGTDHSRHAHRRWAPEWPSRGKSVQVRQQEERRPQAKDGARSWGAREGPGSQLALS